MEARLTAPATFGRRAVPAPVAVALARSSVLSAEAEAFRRGLSAEARGPSAFARWRRETRAARWAAWGLSFGLTASGVASLVVHAPLALSAGLEAGGLGLGWWLRRARRRRLAEVRGWEPDPLG